MNPKILEILKYNSEGPALDYKKESYSLGKHSKKNDFLKDIISFANHPSNEDKYIFVGVMSRNGLADEFFDLDDLLDDANYQDFVDANIEPDVNFEFKTFEFQEKTLGYFRIFDNDKRPYLFKKNVPNSVKVRLIFIKVTVLSEMVALRENWQGKILS